MTMPLRFIKRYRERKTEENRRLALAGKATSGHLNPGERQRLFRNRRKER